MKSKIIKLLVIFALFISFILNISILNRSISASAETKNITATVGTSEEVVLASSHAYLNITNNNSFNVTIKLNSVLYSNNINDDMPITTNAFAYRFNSTGTNTNYTLGRNLNLSSGSTVNFYIIVGGATSFRVNYTVTDTRVKLTAPTLSFDEGTNTLSWTATAIGANTNYAVYRYNTLLDYTSDTSYTVSEDGEYRVIAKGNGTTSIDSDFSNTITVNSFTPSLPIQLDSPFLSYNSASKTLSWTATNPLNKYQVYLDYSPIAIVNTTEYVVNQNGRYQVRAIGDNINYTDSGNSNPQTVTNIATPPVLSYNADNNTLSWTATDTIEGREYQVYNVTSESIAIETDQTFYNPRSSGTYKVREIGNGINTFDSEWSNEVEVVVDDIYYIGYTDGFNDGRQEGILEGYQNGYANGYEIGKNDGYLDAVDADLSASGLLAGAFAFIKLLFTLLGDFFSKPIAGDITIGLILIGIPLVFLIIEGIINLVLIFFRKGS